jgi:hypothetical protein
MIVFLQFLRVELRQTVSCKPAAAELPAGPAPLPRARRRACPWFDAVAAGARSSAPVSV